MPRSFTTRERARIREALIGAGREAFARHGLDRTRVEDLTEAAGISKGAFYAFFPSKQILYWEVTRAEEERLQKRIMLILGSPAPLTRERLKAFFREAFEMVNRNALLKRLLQRQEHDRLVRGLPPELVERHTEEDLGRLRPLIERWQSQGSMVDRPPEQIVGAIRALFIMALHREEIGEDWFEGTVDLLMDCLAEGLVLPPASIRR